MKRSCSLVLAAAFALACVPAGTPVPAGAQSFFGGVPIDGIRCDSMEGAAEHVHASLQIYDRGHALPVPAGVGIAPADGCLYWIHTHAADDVLHIESPVARTFTLGEFFDVWDEPLSWTRAAGVRAPRGKRLSIWVNGRPWRGVDPRRIVLRDHERIVIQNGPPFAHPPGVQFP